MSKVPADVRAEMARRYVYEKQSMNRIGLDLFWTRDAVKRALILEGVEIRRRGETPPAPRVDRSEVDLVAEMYRGGGLSDAEIGRRLGLHATTVMRRRLKAGVPTRPAAEQSRLSRLREIAQGGGNALTPNQRAVLAEVERAAPDSVTTTQIADRLGLLTRHVRDLLEHMEGFGLLASRRTTDRHGRVREWRRTDLALEHVLWHALNGHSNAGARLPVAPMREWLERLIDREKRLRNAVSISTLKEETDGVGVRKAVADRFGVPERELYAILNERKTVTLTTADRLLTVASDGTRLTDLWPDIGPETELAVAA